MSSISPSCDQEKTHTHTHKKKSALIFRCDCVLGNTSEGSPTVGFPLGERGCLKQLPDICLSVVGDTVLITRTCNAVLSSWLITVSDVYSSTSQLPHASFAHQNSASLVGRLFGCAAEWKQRSHIYLVWQGIAFLLCTWEQCLEGLLFNCWKQGGDKC